MGFDINITMDMLMCPGSGKPFYYKYNKETKVVDKIYDFSNIIVPGKMCEYLEGRGHIFHAYTHMFNEKDVYNVSVDEFLEEYPTWEDVVKSPYYDDADHYWIEEDHLGFKRTLEWCAEQDVSFRVCWSY
jgi:hypothetical protein